MINNKINSEQISVLSFQFKETISDQKKYLMIDTFDDVQDGAIKVTNELSQKAHISAVSTELSEMKRLKVEEKDVDAYNKMIDLFRQAIATHYTSDDFSIVEIPFLEAFKHPIKETSLFKAQQSSNKEKDEILLLEVVKKGQELGLSFGETIAIYLYTAQFYRHYNPYVRGQNEVLKLEIGRLKEELAKQNSDDLYSEIQMDIDDYTTQIKEELDLLDNELKSGFKKLPAHKGKVYRGDILTDNELEKMKSGVYLEKAVLSTSNTDKDWAKWVFRDTTNPEEKHRAHIIIDSNNGKNIASLSKSPSEDEISFTPGTKFKVKSIEEKTEQWNSKTMKYYEIHMEES